MSTQFTNRQWRLPNEENKSKVSNYSMDFDGSSYIDLGDDDMFSFGDGFNDSPFSISAWVNATNFSPNGIRIITKCSNSWGGREYQFYIDSSGKLLLLIYDDSQQAYRLRKYDTSLNTGQWYHVAATYNGSGGSNAENGIKLFLNGTYLLSTVTTSYGNYIAMENTTTPAYIGTMHTYYSNGKIDAVSIFNYELSSSQVTTLYGSSSTGIGNPMSLSPKPVASYNLGDKSAFNSANYLVPNIAAQEDDGDIAVSYSPYALDFDSASSDYIDCGNDSSFDITSALTLSAWVKLSSVTTDQFYISKRGGSSANAYQISSFSNKAAGMSIWIGGSRKDLLGTTNHAQDTWYHVVGTYDGLNMRIYLNGVEENSVAQTGVIDTTTTKLILGAYDGVGYSFDGSISNCSIWNTALTSTQVSEIYNEGVPSNLNNHSAYSNLVSWWQLGSNSSFNTNWTVLDEKGSNNGTSVNMTEDAIVDGVGSYANGVSSGMSDNIVGNAPYSNANSLSYNMDVLDRTEDTPS